MDHYEALGIGRDAGQAQVRAAYRSLARRHHPDAGGDPAAFRRVAEAYAVLSDPARREAYDLGSMAAPPGRGGAAPEDPSPLGWDEMLDGLGGWPEEPSFAAGAGRVYASLRVTPEEAEAGFAKRLTVAVPGRPARAVVDVSAAPGRTPPYEVAFPGMGAPGPGGWGELVVRVSLSPRAPGGPAAGI